MDELKAVILVEEINELTAAGKQGDELASKYQEAGRLVVDEDPKMAVMFYEKALKTPNVTKELKSTVLGDMAYALESLGRAEEADSYIEVATLLMQSERSDKITK